MRVFAAALLLLAAGCSFSPPGLCSDDAQCGKGRVCMNGVCVGCDSDADCRGWQSCTVSSRTCVSDPGRCTVPEECEAWEVCDATHTCRLAPGACFDASNCESFEDCTNHRCRLQAGRCYTLANCGGFFPSCSAEHWCESVPPDGSDILIWGTLYEGSCVGDAIAPLSNPRAARVGFGCYSSWTNSARLRPSDGRVLYPSGEHDPVKIVEFVQDAWRWDTTFSDWLYPSDGWQDDVAVPTPRCRPTQQTNQFVLRERTGQMLYACANETTWFDADADTTVVTDAHLRAWNAGGKILGQTGSNVWTVWDPAFGTSTKVVGLPSWFYVIDARAHGDGFWFALANEDATYPYPKELWTIDGSGLATMVGTYGPKPPRASNGSGYLLDAAGALYGEDWDTDIVFNDIVVKYTPDGSEGVIVYWETDAPANANVTPGNLWVFFHISYMFRGP